jgi:hypothetical protein
MDRDPPAPPIYRNRWLQPFRHRPVPGFDSENEKLLYGRLLPDVRLLRQRGFGVHMEGDRYRVGNRLMGARRLQSIAARERRLMEGD